MELTGRTAVVTGAGQGLGAAIASRLAERGARVVVADLNGSAASNAADAIGGIAIDADLSREEEVQRVVATAHDAFGAVDLWFSNAAYSRATDLLTVSDDDWDLGWRLNVMSHVWASRALLPGWTERGSGCLAQTVSAVALTLNHHDAVYATTKRAALALNEFLSTNYGSRGIQVACFCPRGMRTPRLEASVRAGNPAAINALDTSVTPDEAARIAVDGIEAGRFLITTESDELDSHRTRAQDYDGWITARQHQWAHEHAVSIAHRKGHG